jgi:4'-phosphopantetheinyl transferase EntD
VVGAISHTKHLAVAVVGPSVRWWGLGVDVERIDRSLEAGTRRIIARDEEHPWLDAPPALVEESALLWLTMAKEVVFKAMYPPTGVRLGFKDAITRAHETGVDADVVRDLDALGAAPYRLSVQAARTSEYLVLAGGLPR